MNGKKTVLIIEDDEWLAENHARVLGLAGYNTQIALNDLAAIKIIDDSLPDIIILDVLLTSSTAFTLLHEIRSYSDTIDIPIILCTNLADELSINDLSPYGIKKVVNKTTMLPDDLVVAVRGVS